METTEKITSKALNVSLWIAQIILAAIFIMAGFPKATTPIEQLAASLPFAAETPDALIRFIGILEILGGIGLLLPGMLRIKPILIPYAALGLVVIMILAMGYHISKGEFGALNINIGLGLLAGFVAWGRLNKAPIISRDTISVKNS